MLLLHANLANLVIVDVLWLLLSKFAIWLIKGKSCTFSKLFYIIINLSWHCLLVVLLLFIYLKVLKLAVSRVLLQLKECKMGTTGVWLPYYFYRFLSAVENCLAGGGMSLNKSVG